MTTPLTAEPAPASPVQRTNLLSIISVIAGFMVPVAGIVTGFLALNQIKRTAEEGRPLALTGIIAGFALTAFQLAFFIVWFTLFFGAFGTMSSHSMVD